MYRCSVTSQYHHSDIKLRVPPSPDPVGIAYELIKVLTELSQIITVAIYKRVRYAMQSYCDLASLLIAIQHAPVSGKVDRQ
jgi:hypothetical protein